MNINYKKYKHGFTIAEILIVIAIMSILTSIIYVSLDGSKRQSRDQKRVAEISSVQLALEQFYSRNKYYPSVLSFVTYPDFKRYLGEIPSGVKYAPLNDMDSSNPGTKCGSYHLYTVLESKSSILDSKQGFNSSGLISNKCGTYNDNLLINASLISNALVYDVTP